MKQRPGFPARLPESGSPPARTKQQAATAAATPTLRVSSTPLAVRPLAAVGRHGLAAPTAPTVPVVRASGHGMDSSAVRMNMVAKLAGQGISDAAVLAAFGAVERHLFVDSALVNQAYEDTSLPIGLGQTISKPGVVSRMLELLRKGSPGKLGRVLEVGTGCGYQAALLSHLATEVYSIERLRGLHDKARANLRPLRLPNLHLLLGDGMAGYAKGAPYAAIIAAAGGDAVPQAWLDQLAVGGRLVAPVAAGHGGTGGQALVVIDRDAGGYRQTMLEPVHFVPLKSGVA